MPIYKAKTKCFVGGSLRNADEEFEYNGEPCTHLEVISGAKPQEPVAPAIPTPVEVPEVEPTTEELIDDSTTGSVDYDSMTKAELEEYGRTVGLELDRRQTRDTLIAQLEEVNG